MKRLSQIALVAAFLLPGACVSGPEIDRAAAFEKCESIGVVTSRDRCYAEAIRKSQQDRAEQAASQQKTIERAEERELQREIADAEEKLGD